MLHKTGSRAFEEEGLTTPQWAVLGALSREPSLRGMSLGDLARSLTESSRTCSGSTQTGTLLKMASAQRP